MKKKDKDKEKENSKVSQEAKRDLMWAQMRENEDKLHQIVLTGNIDKDDFILFYSCLQLIMVDVDLYENYYLDNMTPKYKNKDLFDPTSPKDPENFARNIILEIKEQLDNLNRIKDKGIGYEEKQNILEQFRIDIWGKLILNKDMLNNVYNSYPVLSQEEVSFLFRCITIVLFELIVRQIEINLIDGEI